jgi:uncharacterized integral membrane protein
MFYLIIVLFLLIGGALTVVAVQNLSVAVQLTLFAWHSPSLPLGLWIVGAFFVGALLLYLVSMVSAWHDRREIKKLRRYIGELEKQKQAAMNVAQPVTPNVPAQPVNPNPSGLLQPQPNVPAQPANPNPSGRLQTQPVAPMMAMPGVTPKDRELQTPNFRQ